jgi:hypothetical protein
MSAASGVDQLLSSLEEWAKKGKLEPQHVADLYWSTTSDGRAATDIRMPQAERVDSWHEQRRAMKENQIRLARASDQQVRRELRSSVN